MRRYGITKPNVYYRPRPGAYGIFWRKKKVLLTFQGAPFFEWQLPGGGIDFGESPIQALRREGFEETGWALQVERKITTYKKFDYLDEYGFYAEKICNIFEGRALFMRGNPTEPGHEAAFFDPEIAINILHNRPDSAILKRVFQRKL